MVMRLRNVVLAGVCGVLASQRDGECMGSNCLAQHEDAAMVQLARPKVAISNISQRKHFARNTRPFLGDRVAGLHQNQHGAITITEDGVDNTYYLPGATVKDGGRTVEFVPPYRFYLMKTPTTDYSNANNFYKPYFPGKTFTVDMNFGVNGASCGCNLNFYLVDMPVDFEGDDHDYYCDAQCFVGKGCCAEFDMNEGNMAVQQITNHACSGSGSYPGHPDWSCHKWGEPELKTHRSEFGIGSQYTIDSTKPFTFSQRFDVEGGSFKFTTTMAQEGRELTKIMGPHNSELDNMLKVLEKGMAFVTGYWSAPDMNWMDGEACGTGPEHCNNHPAHISNWRITSNSGPVPPSPNPNPVPGPVPHPDPTPASHPSGKCCWGPQCSNCKGSENWCGKSVDNCWACQGGWCAVPHLAAGNKTAVPGIQG